MKKTIFKRLLSVVLAFVLVFSVVSVGSFASSSTLFTMTDATVRQGEEFEISIKFARTISSGLNPTAALDISLEYNSEIYTPVSVTMGDGLKKALDKIQGNESNLETNYIYSSSISNPGVVKWSLLTIGSFNFIKGEEFMKVRFKANELSDLNKNQNMKILITNAAAPDTLKDTTANFAPFTNNMEVEANYSKLCDWEYVEALNGYRLVKFNVNNAKSFIIPAEYDDPDDDKGALPVASIGSGAFRNCKTIEKVTLSENIVEVGTAAFMGCDELKKLVVLSAETRFGANALYGTSPYFVLKCKKGSVADEYAQKNDITVEYFESVADCSYEGFDEKLYYTGAPVEHSQIKVYNPDGQLMTYGADYTYTYTDNVEIGKGKAIFTGVGEYLGTHTVEFDVLCPYHEAGNTYYTEVAVYSDCSLPGKIVKDCSFCLYHDESAVAPAKEHGELVDVVGTESTCTVKGTMNHICKDCTQIVSTSEIELKDHTETTEWVTVAEATCEEAGKQVRYCANCEHVFEEKEIPATGHHYSVEVIEEATCSATGREGTVCDACGDIYAEKELPIVDHDIQWVVTTEPTCTEKGVETLQCRFCGYHEGETAQTREAKATGHTGGEWVIIKEATCEEPGEKVKYCVIDDCGVVVEKEEIPETGHNFSEWFTAVELTCTTDGIEARTCDCGAREEKVNKASGHVEGEWEILSELTCTQDGHKVKHCETCGEKTQDVTEKAPGHKSGDWEVVPATCAKEGAKNHYCSVCEEIYETIAIESPAHTPGEWTVIFEADCTHPGMKQKVCTVCGEAVDAEEIPATGHKDFRIETYIHATYKFEGKDRAICNDCGKLIREIPTKRLNPDIDGNGTVASSDALLILQHSTGLKPLAGDQLRNANLDGIGTANSADALIVLQIATGLITA